MNARYGVLTVAYCGMIFFLSSQAIPPEPPRFWFEGLDKLTHMALYGGLAGVVWLGLRRARRPVPSWAQWAIPVLFASLYGITDELHQCFVPTRSADVWDWLADTAGAAAAMAVLRVALARGTKLLARGM